MGYCVHGTQADLFADIYSNICTALFLTMSSLLLWSYGSLVCCTQFSEVSVLFSLLAGFVEESDPCDNHGELIELLLLVLL